MTEERSIRATYIGAIATIVAAVISIAIAYATYHLSKGTSTSTVPFSSPATIATSATTSAATTTDSTAATTDLVPTNTTAATPTVLTEALLPESILGTATQIVGPEVSSTAKQLCAGLSPAVITVSETLANDGEFLYEGITRFDGVATASAFVQADRQTVDAAGGCTETIDGISSTYGEYAFGSIPSTCMAPGEYFTDTVSGGGLSGLRAEVQCGPVVIRVEILGSSPSFGSSTINDTVYLSEAVSRYEES